MYTTHGHLIPGTIFEKGFGNKEPPVPECEGGIRSCPKCVGEAWHATQVKLNPNDDIRKASYMDDLEPQTKAKFLVAQYFNDHRENPAEIAELTLNDVQITSFSKHYRNWKATATTNANDGIHYDVSYNGYLSETHLVIYKHVTRVVIADQR